MPPVFTLGRRGVDKKRDVGGEFAIVLQTPLKELALL